MSLKFELDLVDGESFALELEAAGAASSSYFLFQNREDCDLIWPLTMALLSDAGRPVCQLDEELRRAGLNIGDVTPISLQALLDLDGYAFCLPWAFERLAVDLDQRGRRTYVFLRDPRRAFAETLEDSSEMSLKSEPVESIVEDLRAGRQGYVDFARNRKHVTFVRTDDAIVDGRNFAPKLAQVLQLSVPDEVMRRIANGDAPAPNTAATPANRIDASASADPDVLFADVFAEFDQGSAASLIEERPGQPMSTPTAAPPADGPQDRARQLGGGLTESDPELMYRLKPGAAVDITILGRRLKMDVDAFGSRPVLGQPNIGEKTFSAFGCSCTYGFAVAAEETFCSLLQGMLPKWRIENNGVNGYSTVQSMMHLRRNSRFFASDYVSLFWIDRHPFRNVASMAYAQHLMEFLDHTGQRDIKQALCPCARLDKNGDLELASFRFPRWDIYDLDYSDFQPDKYYLDLVCAKVLIRAMSIVERHGGHFFVTALFGTMSNVLRKTLADNGVPLLDASLDGLEHTCWPDDLHPNARSHAHYASKVRDYLIARESERTLAQ